MNITNGITMLEISAFLLGEQRTVYPTLLWDEQGAHLVDAGYPGQAALIRGAIETAGVPWKKLTDIILTHHDLDHIGSAAAIRSEVQHPVRILAHRIEKPYVDGENRPLKLAQMESRLDVLPEPLKAVYENLKNGFRASSVSVDATLEDGQVLPILGGVVVIHTPGHTLGHISLYHPGSRTLIAGDILMVKDGVLTQAPPSTNHDAALYRASLQKLTKLDIQTVICYHGGLYKDDPNKHIAELAALQA